MLIAAKSTGEAELFKTALQLTASEEIVPDKIKNYFALVLKQAKKLKTCPDSISSDVIPEAIDLALEFIKTEPLSDSLDTIDQIDALSKEEALNILKIMEYRSVY